MQNTPDLRHALGESVQQIADYAAICNLPGYPEEIADRLEQCTRKKDRAALRCVFNDSDVGRALFREAMRLHRGRRSVPRPRTCAAPPIRRAGCVRQSRRVVKTVAKKASSTSSGDGDSSSGDTPRHLLAGSREVAS